MIMLLMAKWSLGQKEQLVLSEQNKYTYFQVRPLKHAVEAADLAKYLKKEVSGIKVAKAEQNAVKGSGDILMYKKGLITSQEQAAINYTLSIDFKDSKYRILITDLVYVPYQRNRYGVFAPIDGAGVDLETKKAKLTAEQFDEVINMVANYCVKLDRSINDHVNNAPERAEKAKTDTIKRVNTKNW
jgi:hypothetical protein